MIDGVRCVDATQIYTADQRVGPCLMVGVDAASLTEIMLCGVGAKAVEAKVFRALSDFER